MTIAMTANTGSRASSRTTDSTMSRARQATVVHFDSCAGTAVRGGSDRLASSMSVAVMPDQRATWTTAPARDAGLPIGLGRQRHDVRRDPLDHVVLLIVRKPREKGKQQDVASGCFSMRQR